MSLSAKSTYFIVQPKWAVKYYIHVNSPSIKSHKHRHLNYFDMDMFLEEVSDTSHLLKGDYQTPFNP